MNNMDLDTFIWLLLIGLFVSVIPYIFLYLYKRSCKKEIWGKDFLYRCPRCYSTNLGYLSAISNFLDVFQNHKKPKYESKFICHNCDLLDNCDKLIKEKIHIE